jgi:hypothetical protein
LPLEGKHLIGTWLQLILGTITRGINIIWWKWLSEITWKSWVNVPKRSSNDM